MAASAQDVYTWTIMLSCSRMRSDMTSKTSLWFTSSTHLTASATELITTVRHADVRIHSWSIDLTQGPAQIEAAMDHLAEREADTSAY